jgi:hypothetical protein
MHELYGDVLRIRYRLPSAEREQPAAAPESVRHLTANLRQVFGFALEEGDGRSIPVVHLPLDEITDAQRRGQVVDHGRSPPRSCHCLLNARDEVARRDWL